MMIETSLFKGVSWEDVRAGICRCLAGLSYGADMLSTGLLANPLAGDLAAVYFFRMQEDHDAAYEHNKSKNQQKRLYG